MKYKVGKLKQKLTRGVGRLYLPALSKILLILVSSNFLYCCLDNEQSLDERISSFELQTLPEVTHPFNNPSNPEKIELGRMLFYDPILSGEKDIACVKCHWPDLGYADAIDLSRGPGGFGLGADRVGGTGRPVAIRNSTSIINSAYVGLRDVNQTLDVLLAPMTWAINRRALEPQATAVALLNPTHMRGKAKYDANSVGDTLSNRLKKIPEYVDLFSRVFGSPEGSINYTNIGKALGAFQRSIISNNSPYDKYAKGQTDALTAEQKTGLLLFFGKANCANCHAGPMYSDYGLYNLGIKDHPLVNNPKDKGSNGQRLFRTPSLRNVALTAPYMHNGTISSLSDVIDFYDKGESENDSINHNQMSIKIQPLHLTENEKEELISFLAALTDDSYDKSIPARVPSGLKVGGN